MDDQMLSREAIIEKSSVVFREMGYANSSIAMLANACDISKSHFYYYFAGKEMLMEEILKEELRFFTDKVFIYAYEEAFSPKKRLKKLLKKIEDAFCSNNIGSLMTITVFHATSGEGETFYPVIRQYYEELQKALFTVFNLKYGEKKSRRLTVSTVLQIEGAMTFMVMNKDCETLQQVIREVVNRFLKK